METKYFILIAGDKWNNLVKNLANHDSMSGEHVGTTFGLIVTSGKSDIWPLESLENQGFR